jgi:hypothetical protein
MVAFAFALSFFLLLSGLVLDGGCSAWGQHQLWFPVTSQQT